MKKNIFSLSVLFAVAPQAVQAATCTLNGETVPCDTMPGWIWLIPVVAVIVGILSIVFWILMLVDAIKH